MAVGVERARRRLAKSKRSKIVSTVSDDEEYEGDKDERERNRLPRRL